MSLENPIIPLAELRVRLRLPDTVPDDITLASIVCNAVNILEKQIEAEMELAMWDVRYDSFPAYNEQELVFPGLNSLVERISYTNPATKRVNTLTAVAGTLPIVYQETGRVEAHIKAPTAGWPAVVPGTVVIRGSRGYTPESLPFDLREAVIIKTGQLESGIVSIEPDAEIERLLKPYMPPRTLAG